jgi:3-phenylpropionate/trans-cinnamate dioxygenase ferredoxin reductase subunit
MSAAPIVIVGAGLAGAKAAEALRGQGFDGEVVLIGEESERPYDRPPLSKGYLSGSADRDSVFVHPPQWYDKNRIDLRLRQRVTAISPARHSVALADGSAIEYTKLLLTTGSRPRMLPIPGGDLPGILTLRQLSDSERIKNLLVTAESLVIIGAGWIGLEVAAAARTAGMTVTVIETATLPLVRVLGSEIAQVFANLHRSRLVDLRLGTSPTEITTAPDGTWGVRLSDGSEVGADAVLVGVGIQPNTELAEQAGIRVDNGIVVNAALRTSEEDIFAAGDVASAFHPLIGKHIRVEHWANALNQPATAVSNMLGHTASYERLPYFFTDQYDLGMEYVGYVEPSGYDAVVVRGDLTTREFIAFWTKDNRVLAGMNVNIWDVGDRIKALIASRSAIDPIALADPDIPL